jgi:hypothetical protein
MANAKLRQKQIEKTLAKLTRLISSVDAGERVLRGSTPKQQRAARAALKAAAKVARAGLKAKLKVARRTKRVSARKAEAGGYKRDMTCRYGNCSAVSKGPRFHFLCEKHLDKWSPTGKSGRKPRKAAQVSTDALEGVAKSDNADAAAVTDAAIDRLVTGAAAVTADAAIVLDAVAEAKAEIADTDEEAIADAAPAVEPDAEAEAKPAPETATDVVRRAVQWGQPPPAA